MSYCDCDYADTGLDLNLFAYLKDDTNLDNKIHKSPIIVTGHRCVRPDDRLTVDMSRHEYVLT